MSTFHRCTLHPHPSNADTIADTIAVEIQGRSHVTRLIVDFGDETGGLRLPEGQLDPERLWEHTCVELFASRTEGPGYVEWNFSPTGQVTRFTFSAYRERVVTDVFDSVSVLVERHVGRTRVIVEGELVPEQTRAAAVTAVVRGPDGHCAHWAITHPRVQPDFHDSAGFTLSPKHFGR